MAAQIKVKSTSEDPGASIFDVELTEGNSQTSHRVQVTREDLARWGRGSTAEDLVRRSFEFLLERESKESIRRRFNLSVIQQYFPDYDRAMRG